MTEETFEYLRDYTFMMRDKADCQENTDEGRQIASELKILVNTIEIAVDIAIGIKDSSNINYLTFCSKSIKAHIDDLKKKYSKMTWDEKVADKGEVLREVYHMIEVNKVFSMLLNKS